MGRAGLILCGRIFHLEPGMLEAALILQCVTVYYPPLGWVIQQLRHVIPSSRSLLLPRSRCMLGKVGKQRKRLLLGHVSGVLTVFAAGSGRVSVAMSEGSSGIAGPIPPDPTMVYKRPASARGRLNDSSFKLDLLPGPLAPDPTLYPKCYTDRPANPSPRVRANARDILERGQRGSVGILLQFEGIPFYSNSQPKKKVKNHEKENVRRLREIQKKCKEKELENNLLGPQPVKALWKSNKYENVESKVKMQLQEQAATINAESQKFLRAHSRCGSVTLPNQSCSPRPSRPTSAVPDQDFKVLGSSINFIAHNAKNAKKAQIRRSRSLQSLNEVLGQKKQEQNEYDIKQKGHVPQYLIDLKEKMRKEKEEQQKMAPDPSCPPGHTMMPEAKRQETLRNIKQSQDQLLKELLSLPVRADTLSIQNRRTELEKKLSEIEEALKIFSRSKVFIKTDS
uniref:Enkurin domain-containing protein n=2 Tax=Leptobrachium leishanense TaxID=445787 RepID=A0A8C5MXN9_9ANUR